MAMFTYVARNSAGRAQQGTQEAPSAAALVNTLRERGWLILEVRAADAPAAAAGLSQLNPLNLLPIRSIHIELSLQQMSVMLRSGLTLLATLKTVAEYSRSRAMRRVWEDVADKIQRGSSLADALAEHRCFSHMVVELIRLGEQTGILEKVVTRASEALERRRMLRNQMINALFYPALVFFAAIGTAAFMIVYLIPKLQVFLSALGRKLPAMTQRLVDVSTFCQAYGLPIVIGLVALTGGLIALYLHPTTRLIMDRVLLRLPGIGYLLRLAATIQFSHGLAVLLESGVTLVNGLQAVERQQRNRWAAERVANARTAVLGGAGLAEPLAVSGVFMPMLSRMVAVGETSGTLDEVLAEVARFHENRLQSTIRWLSTIIEPVIVVVVGGIVGFVYISFFLAFVAAAAAQRGVRVVPPPSGPLSPLVEAEPPTGDGADAGKAKEFGTPASSTGSLKDPTRPSSKMRDVLNAKPRGAAKASPLALRGRIIIKGKPPAALLEVDGKLYTVAKGSVLTGTNTLLKVLEIDSEGVRVESTTSKEVFLLR
jgi:type IV pilus assembly protein PilC